MSPRTIVLFKEATGATEWNNHRRGCGISLLQHRGDACLAQEGNWAAILSGRPIDSVPVSGFGSVDCAAPRSCLLRDDVDQDNETIGRVYKGKVFPILRYKQNGKRGGWIELKFAGVVDESDLRLAAWRMSRDVAAVPVFSHDSVTMPHAESAAQIN